MLKRIALVAVTVAAIVAAGVAGVWLWDQVSSPVVAQTSEATADHSPAQTITVVGQGSVKVKPDIARVSIGVETSGETVGEAVAENESQMASILAALKEAGVAEKDIQTMNFSINLDRYPEPRIEPAPGEAAQPVYRVSNMANVTVRDLEAVGDVLDAVIEAGANNIWGISFALEDTDAAEADARSKAIEDAKARAAALAELNGVELGPVMAVSEVVGGNVYPVGVRMETAAAAGGGTISPGELEIGYQVQVSYFIEQ